MKKIITIVGARPQFIKAATLSRVIARNSDLCEVLIHTGQHFDANMSDVFFNELEIRRPDYNLGIGGGTHGQNTGRMIEAIEKILIVEKPDCVLIYGDTDSTLAGALAAVKMHIPIAHIEAGLRSFNRTMPEEINRVLTDHASDLLLTPTTNASMNLIREGIKETNIKMVGDVMYDAMLYYSSRAKKPGNLELKEDGPFFLCTVHRAENTNDPLRLKAIVHFLNRLSELHTLVLPLHPRTAQAIDGLGEKYLSDKIAIITPVGYLEMSWLISRCSMVITDSGGLQKEAFFHRKPCVTIREETEWVELVNSGMNRLISPFDIDHSHIDFNIDESNFKTDLFGMGDASIKIVKLLYDL
jgi:UDP-GlcNAc3NAcA epimerase